MTKINDDSKKQTLKKMLSIAKTLVENESIEIFELAHYIADNVLSKTCMLIGIEQEGENSIYDSSNRKAKKFPVLYQKILEKNYTNVPKYNVIKKYHRERNAYNLEIKNLDLSIRQPFAKEYIEIVEGILKEVGYLGVHEKIEPSPLISNTQLNSLQFSEINQFEQKFKNLFERLRSKNPAHIIIEVKALLQDIGEINLAKVLKMRDVQGNKERMMLIEDGKWNLSVQIGVSSHLRLIKYLNGNSQTYDFEIPDENEDILIEFLKLIKERCKNEGIIL